MIRSLSFFFFLRFFFLLLLLLDMVIAPLPFVLSPVPLPVVVVW